MKKILVYGKMISYWTGHENLFQRLHDEGFEIHGTLPEAQEDKSKREKLPEFVVNHGLLDGAAFKELLSTAGFFLGLGFPYEGPAPLEAIAAGAIFINPKLDPPHGRRSEAVKESK